MDVESSRRRARRRPRIRRAAAAALLGCGGSDDKETAASATTAPNASATSAPVVFDGVTTAKGRKIPYNFSEPSKPPKSGGTMRQSYTFDPGQLDPTGHRPEARSPRSTLPMTG